MTNPERNGEYPRVRMYLNGYLTPFSLDWVEEPLPETLLGRLCRIVCRRPKPTKKVLVARLVNTPRAGDIVSALYQVEYD